MTKPRYRIYADGRAVLVPFPELAGDGVAGEASCDGRSSRELPAASFGASPGFSGWPARPAVLDRGTRAHVARLLALSASMRARAMAG